MLVIKTVLFSHLTSAFCTTWQNKKPSNYCTISIKAVCCFANKHTKHIQIITFSWLHHYSSAKIIDCMHQTTYEECIVFSHLCPTPSKFAKSVMMSVTVSKMGVVLHLVWITAL